VTVSIGNEKWFVAKGISLNGLIRKRLSKLMLLLVVLCYITLVTIIALMCLLFL